MATLSYHWCIKIITNIENLQLYLFGVDGFQKTIKSRSKYKPCSKFYNTAILNSQSGLAIIKLYCNLLPKNLWGKFFFKSILSFGRFHDHTHTHITEYLFSPSLNKMINRSLGSLSNNRGVEIWIIQTYAWVNLKVLAQ